MISKLTLQKADSNEIKDKSLHILYPNNHFKIVKHTKIKKFTHQLDTCAYFDNKSSDESCEK